MLQPPQVEYEDLSRTLLHILHHLVVLSCSCSSTNPQRFWTEENVYLNGMWPYLSGNPTILLKIMYLTEKNSPFGRDSISSVCSGRKGVSKKLRWGWKKALLYYESVFCCCNKTPNDIFPPARSCLLNLSQTAAHTEDRAFKCWRR